MQLFGHQLLCRRLFLFAQKFSGDLDSSHKAESDECEDDCACDVHAAGRLDLLECLDVAPWPHLHERTDDESGKDDERLLVPAGEQPVQELRESEDADNRSDEENGDDRQVASDFLTCDESRDDAHDVLIFSEDQEDEAA